MTRVVIVHGMPSRDEFYEPNTPSESNAHWLPWLQKQLLIRDHQVQTPEMPRPFEPHYEAWSEEFERHLTDDPMMLVGHSCGGGFLVRWLSEHQVSNVHKVALVAPWLDPFRTTTEAFFDFDIDSTLVDRVGEIHLFLSGDDEGSIQESASMLTERVPGIVCHDYADMGHFCGRDMPDSSFPDLLHTLEA